MIFVDDDSASQIAITTSDGKLKIEWDEKKAELRITGDQKVIIKATQEITLQSDKDINLKAQGNIKLEGTGGVDMKSSASFKVEGSTVDVKGSGPVSVSGAMVKLG